MDEIKVAIIEDNKDIRHGLRLIINSSPGFCCTQAYSSAEEGLKGISPENTDVVFMDIELPGINGIEATSRLKSAFPQLQVLMLTVFNDTDRIFEALEAGATGYLLKKTPPAKLLEAITEVHSGSSPMSGEIARKVVQFFSKPKPIPQPGLLTQRERELLDLLSQGFRYKEIAGKLFISTNTVRSHIRNIYEKLHVQGKVEAINKLREASV